VGIIGVKDGQGRLRRAEKGKGETEGRQQKNFRKLCHHKNLLLMIRGSAESRLENKRARDQSCQNDVKILLRFC
jgi:hypothetical protein